MKKKSKGEIGRTEYDLTTLRPNTYAERIQLYGSNLVVIEPDLFQVFPNSDAVNDALRLMVKASTKAIRTKSAKQGHAEAKAS